MLKLVVSKSGSFRIGGEIPVHRLGFGAMRITGAGIWGPPEDRDEAIRTLKRLPELGIDFIDTANSYGPDVSEAADPRGAPSLRGDGHRHQGGADPRAGRTAGSQKGDPDYLIAEAEHSREKLGVERIDLWQLHRIDRKVPRDEQFAAVRSLIDRGVIRFAGLSEVTVEEIEAARRVFPVATVQNRYNLVDRTSEAVLDFCAAEGIGFMPWHPAGSRRAGAAGLGPQRHRGAARAGAGPGGAGLGAAAQPGDAADPGHLEGRHLEENVAAARSSSRRQSSRPSTARDERNGRPKDPLGVSN